MRPPDGRCTMCRDYLDKDAYCERCQVSFAPTPEEWTVTFCPECGWEAAVDEDGLCQTCGCIAVGRAVEEMATWRNYSLRTHSPSEPTPPVHDGHCTTCGAPAEIVEGEEGTVSVVRSEEPVGYVVVHEREGWDRATIWTKYPWFADEDDALTVHPIGQPLDGEGT